MIGLRWQKYERYQTSHEITSWQVVLPILVVKRREEEEAEEEEEEEDGYEEERKK